MWTVDRAALVFCIDQVEDLRFFDDPQERFQKAGRDLIQIANRVPTSIVLVSCLGDFYGTGARALAQSYIDRIEKAGPCGWRRRAPPRGAAHHRQAPGRTGRRRPHRSQPLFRPAVLRGVQRPLHAAHLELAQTRCASRKRDGVRRAEEKGGFISTLAAALGSALARGRRGEDAPSIDFRETWERFTAQSEAEIPPTTRACSMSSPAR
jgi:hypothetical protein